MSPDGIHIEAISSTDVRGSTCYLSVLPDQQRKLCLHALHSDLQSSLQHQVLQDLDR